MGQCEDRYRAAAAECLKAANRTADLTARATFLLMAQRWIEVADQSIFGQRRLDVALDYEVTAGCAYCFRSRVDSA